MISALNVAGLIKRLRFRTDSSIYGDKLAEDVAAALTDLSTRLAAAEARAGAAEKERDEWRTAYYRALGETACAEGMSAMYKVERDAAEARVAKAAEALKPFAEFLDAIDPELSDDEEYNYEVGENGGHVLTVGDFRRAALAQSPPPAGVGTISDEQISAAVDAFFKVLGGKPPADISDEAAMRAAFAAAGLSSAPSGQDAIAVEAEREACAKIAEWAHMVPPDGGSPTKEERAVAVEAAARIRARSQQPEAPPSPPK